MIILILCVALYISIGFHVKHALKEGIVVLVWPIPVFVAVFMWCKKVFLSIKNYKK